MNQRYHWLLICAALALGEFVASLCPAFSTVWPVAAVAALIVAAFGFGLNIRGWHFVFIFFVGIALFLCASVESERYYRNSPWMRNARRREHRVEESAVQSSVRRCLSDRVGIGLDYDRETAGLNRAILLGERWRISPRMKRIFVESGTIHVFAISGLHVMAVAKVFTLLLALFFVPRRFVGIASIPLLWGYVWVIGFPPSAVRAALMASFYCAAPVFWRRSDSLMAWSISFLCVHLISPRMIVDVGSALSFSVMLAMVVVAEFFRSGGWLSMLLTTFSAWAVGVPIAAHVFGRVSPGGILANLVLIVSAELSVFAGIVGVLVSFISITIAAHFNNLAALFTRVMVSISELVSRLPGANLELPRWSYLQCIEWYVLLALVAYLVHSVVSRHRQSL